MLAKPFVVGVLAVACVTAAGAGAYIAVRQNHDSPAQTAVAAQPTAGTAPSVAVPETEAVVAAPSKPAIPVETPRSVAQTPAPATRLPGPRKERTRTSGTPARAAETAAGKRSGGGNTASSGAPVLAVVPSPETLAVSRTEAATPSTPAEPPRYEPAPPPPAPVFDELEVPSSAVMGLQIQTAVSSDRARVEDRVEARVTRDLGVDGRTAIPAGTRVVGSVTLVEKGGKVKERARLGVRFHTLVLADGTQLPIRTETILREGESPTGESSRKIGGAAAGGAILGAIIGGKKGAIIGGATGAAGGTAAVMAGDRNAATLPVGAVLTVRLSSPLTVAVERQ